MIKQLIKVALILSVFIFTGCFGDKKDDKPTPVETNNAPVFDNSQDINISIAENTSVLDINISASDADGDTLTYTLSGDDKDLFSIDINNSVSFVNVPDFESNKLSYNFDVEVSDGKDTVSKNINISITNLNDNAPTFTSSATVSFVENTIADIITVEASDADNDSITYSMESNETNVLFDSTSGVLSFVIPPNFEEQSNYSVKIKATDGVNSVYQDINISITDVVSADANISISSAVLFDDKLIITYDTNISEDINSSTMDNIYSTNKNNTFPTTSSSIDSNFKKIHTITLENPSIDTNNSAVVFDKTIVKNSNNKYTSDASYKQIVSNNIWADFNISADTRNFTVENENDIAQRMILDNDLQLMWQDNNSSEVNQSMDAVSRTIPEGQEYCSNLTLGGYDNWRLPNIDELLSLATETDNQTDGSSTKLYLNAVFHTAFKYKDKYYFYMSDTYQSEDTNDSYIVNFQIYKYIFIGTPSKEKFVRCVRDTQNKTKSTTKEYKPTYTRTIVDNNSSTAIVYDSSTNIIWQDIITPDKVTYADANSYCEDSNLSGISNWRLPSIEEVRSLRYPVKNTTNITSTYLVISNKFINIGYRIWLNQIDNNNFASSYLGSFDFKSYSNDDLNAYITCVSK